METKVKLLATAISVPIAAAAYVAASGIYGGASNVIEYLNGIPVDLTLDSVKNYLYPNYINASFCLVYEADALSIIFFPEKRALFIEKVTNAIDSAENSLERADTYVSSKTPEPLKRAFAYYEKFDQKIFDKTIGRVIKPGNKR
jgi:hypothetical protein